MLKRNHASKLLVLLALGFAPLLAGCGSSIDVSTGSDGQLRVLATTGMIADAVRQVGGSHVQVDALMGPGIDPHRYTPSPSDTARLSKAQLIFFNGLHLEGKMTDVLEGRGAKAVAVASRLDTATELRTGEGADGSHDPHIWFNVKLWMKAVEVVRDKLAEADPAHAADYKANAERYLAELAKLHDEVKAKADSLPKERRVLVTSHDAFGYFGKAYGFEVHGLQGVSTGSEASTKDVQTLATFLGSHKIPAVFGETSVPPKGLQAVLDSVRQTYKFEVKLIGGENALYSDALGEPGSSAESYVGMVRHNIDVIVAALAR